MKTLIFLSILIISNTVIVSQEEPISEELALIEHYINVMDIVNEDVSGAPIKWHLLHMLQVINGVYAEAEKSNPNTYNSKTNLKWRYTSIFGKIPRGYVKAPNNVNPTYDISEKDIREELEKAKLSLKAWNTLQKNSYYNHHILLHLNKRKIKRFYKVHTKHHLKIVRDILRK